eukprot:403340498
MGALCSQPRNQDQDYIPLQLNKAQPTPFDQNSKVHQDRYLLAKVLQYDLNIGKYPVLTIAKRFARENTNDLGQNLNIASSDIVLLEMKKYLFLCAIEIRDNKDKYIFTQNQKQYFMCPFPCPIYLEKALDLFILYTEHYEKFCIDIFGHWMDKYEPRMAGLTYIPQQEYNDFRKLADLVEKYKSLICPFYNLWNLDLSLEEYFMEKEKLVLHLSLDQRNYLKEFVSQKCKNQISDSIHELKFQCVQEMQNINLDRKFQNITLDSEIFMVENFQHDYKHPKFTQQTIDSKVLLVNQLEFDSFFSNSLKIKLNITENAVQLYIQEYKRFLLMCSLSHKMISPSEQVDHVWHHHQTYSTSKYRYDCLSVLGRFMKHLPAMGGQEDGDKFNNIYDETLDFYTALFGKKPNPQIWEPRELRFSHYFFEHSTVNIYNLIYATLLQNIIPKNNIKNSETQENTETPQHIRKPFISKRRQNYVQNRRLLRKNLKTAIKMQSNYKVYDILEISGAPFIFDKYEQILEKINKNHGDNMKVDLLNEIYLGFYNDFDVYDSFQVRDQYPQLGAQEVMERLVDLGMGDFDVEGNLEDDYQVKPLQMENRVGKLGFGLQDFVL